MEPSLWRSLRAYARAVPRWWWLVIAGGEFAVFNVESVAQRFWPGFAIPDGTWLFVAFLGLSVAQFVAFHSVNKENARLRARVDERERRQAVLALLAERITEGNRLLTQRLGTEDELPPWIGAVDQWYSATVEWLNEALSAAAAASFSTATGFDSAHMPVVNEEHNRYKNLIGFKLTYLRSLAEKLETRG